MRKVIYQGTAEGRYSAKRFKLLVKLHFEGAKTVFHHNPLPPYVAEDVYHIEPFGVTLHYKSPAPQQEATVTAYGSENSIQEVERTLSTAQQLRGIIEKALENVRPDVVEALTRELEANPPKM